MDQLGNIFRELIQRAHGESVRNATSLADELIKEGMNKSQIEEMLCANGFDANVIEEVLEDIYPKPKE